MFPLPGEAADGGDVLPFPFPFGSEEGLVYVQVSRWKRGASNVIQLGIQFKEMEIHGDPTQGKRKGEETSNPMFNTKSAKKETIAPTTNLKKKKKLTSNLQHALRNQCSLVFSFIPPSSFNGIMALPLLHRFSFASRACLWPTGC